MSRQKQEKWRDPRTPVSVTKIGKFTVTIYDQTAYDASLREYPDTPNGKPIAAKASSTALAPLVKRKPAARYNWTEKLKTPLALNVTTDGSEEIA